MSEIEQLSTGPAMQREVSDAALPTTDPTVEETTTPEQAQLASLPTGQADSSDDAARAVGSILTHGSSPGRLAARRVELPWAPDATCFTIENVLSDDECEQRVRVGAMQRTLCAPRWNWSMVFCWIGVVLSL